MRPPRNLREALARAVVMFPFLAGTGCGFPPGGPCGNPDRVVIVGGTVGTMPDGGHDCSVCNSILQFEMLVTGCDGLTVSGTPGVECHVQQVCLTTGRRPATLLSGSRQGSTHPIGRLFAELARLEAASVPAFRTLAEELRAHRAPSKLVEAALRSALDEVRHTRSMSALARRYGAVPTRPSFGPVLAERSLEDIATENAIEGCVRETYGALVALWQADHAKDPVVAGAMSLIAEDESRHAELAWEVAEWANPRMTCSARHRVKEAGAQALGDLANDVRAHVAPLLMSLGGLPPPDAAEALLGNLFS